MEPSRSCRLEVWPSIQNAQCGPVDVQKVSGGDMQSERISLSGLGAALANFNVACANQAQTTRPL